MNKEIGQVLYLNKSNGDYNLFYLEIIDSTLKWNK